MWNILNYHYKLYYFIYHYIIVRMYIYNVYNMCMYVHMHECIYVCICVYYSV